MSRFRLALGLKGFFKGKRVELASTTGIQTFDEIAEDFMLTLFGFDPGQYLITDLSSLHDFVVSFWLAKNVLEGPVPNRRVLAVQQPFHGFVLLRDFHNGCQLVNLRYEATPVPG